MEKTIKALFVSQVFFAVAVALSWTVFLPYLLSEGFTVLDYLVYQLSAFIFSIPFMLWRRKSNARSSMIRGILARGLTFLLIINFVSNFQLVLVAFLFGMMFSEFWVAFNTFFEQHTTKKNRAEMNSSLITLHVLIGIIVPLISGFFALEGAYFWMLIASSFLMVVCAYLTSKMKKFDITFDYKKALSELGEVDGAILTQGYWDGITIVVIPIVTLGFVSNVFEFAAVFSLLGLFGGLAAIFVSKYAPSEDKIFKITAASVILTAVFTSISAFASSFLFWIVSISIMRFFGNIMGPFSWTLITDVSKHFADGMLARELLLNVGRILGIMVSILFLLYFHIQYALITAGLVFAFYPMFLKIKRN